MFLAGKLEDNRLKSYGNFGFLFLNAEEILSQIKKAGFTVALQREVLLTQEQVRQFYAQHVQEDYFPALVHTMAR